MVAALTAAAAKSAFLIADFCAPCSHPRREQRHLPQMFSSREIELAMSGWMLGCLCFQKTEGRDSRSRPVAIYRLLKFSGFDPQKVEIAAIAYEDVLSALQLPKGDRPVTEIVARKVIEIAETGELDPVRISAQAIAQLGIPRAA